MKTEYSPPPGLEGTDPNGSEPPRGIEFVARIWEQREAVFSALYVGLLLSTVLAFFVQPEFESTTKLMPPDKQTNPALSLLMNGADDKFGALAADALGAKGSGSTFTAILQSRTVRDRLIQRFNLQQVYGAPLMETARARLGRNTSVSEEKKTAVIVVTVADESPVRAQALAAAYVEELNRLSAYLSTSAARREREFLELRVVAIKSELEAASQKLSRFSSETVTLEPREQGRAMIGAAASLQAELIASEAQVSALEQIFSSDNVRVRALRAKIAELKKQMREMSDANTSPDSPGYPSLRKLPGLGVTYYDLYRDVRVQEAVYEILTKQLELAKVQEAKEIPTVKVLDEADLPENKSFPKRTLLIAAGTLLAGLLATIYLMLNDRWTRLQRGPTGLFVSQMRNGFDEDKDRLRSFGRRLFRKQEPL